MNSSYHLPGFIEKVRKTRAELDKLLPFEDAARMENANAVGDWSLKDIAAHIVWHENQIIGMIRERALEGSPLWELTTHERNRKIQEEYRDLPLEQVRDEYESAFPLLLDMLRDLSDDELNDPALWREMQPEWSPGKIIAENTYEHYEDHIRDISEKKT